jgi:hypothetical protein
VSDRQYRIERLDDTDRDEVHQWAHQSARIAPMEALIAMTDSRDPTRAQLIEAVVREFPAETREVARAAALAGFEARDAEAAGRG